jgi:hypothetical protein
MVKENRAINTFSVIFFELFTSSLVNSGGSKLPAGQLIKMTM